MTPLKKIMKGLPSEILAGDGLLYQDWTAVTPCQRECTQRLGMTIQIEQEAYLTQHPEVQALLEVFVSKMTQAAKRKDILKEATDFFTKPFYELDDIVRQRLDVPSGPYVKEDKAAFEYDDPELIRDLRKIISKHYPEPEWKISSPQISTPNTPSSSFISMITSDTTLPTPEPVPTPEPTLSETFMAVVSNTVDKAIYSKVDDRTLRYDTAYVMLMQCVEEAMEIPVLEIKEDIAELYYNAYQLFEMKMVEKERIAAEIAWGKRMRKKLKKSLRRMKNYKGYETPPTPKSKISSHESYLIPPQRPCICQPQFKYNRYAKDRFGIYLPKEAEYAEGNVTTTPAISTESLDEDNEDTKVDTKSIASKKSAVSAKSAVSKKSHK